MTSELRAIQPGDPAPEFQLPAADRDGVVSLASYRGKQPVLLALFRGLYCPFCRRQMAQLSPTADRLAAAGVQTIGILATSAERARPYFRLRAFRYPLAADPALVTHRAYGLGQMARDPASQTMIDVAARRLALDLGIDIPDDGDARAVVDAADGFARLPSDAAEREQHQIQMTGQFLVDREGIVRWSRVEDGTRYAVFPSADELVELAARTTR